MPSKKVFIKRSVAFIHEQMNSAVMREYLSYTKRGIGSYFKSKTSKQSGSGLNDEEVKLLLPSVVSRPATHNDFDKEVERFYANINTTIPPGDIGKELEIGLKEDNNKPVSIDNMPINIDEYLAYRHAMKHPHCAVSPEEAKGNSTKQYYIEDPDLVMNQELANIKILDDATSAYMQIKGDQGKIDMVVSLMTNDVRVPSGRPKFNAESATLAEKMVALNQLCKIAPGINIDMEYRKLKRFISTCSNPNITRLYRVNRMLSKGVLKLVGEQIVDEQTRQPLGRTVEEVVNKVFDPQNMELQNRFKLLYAQNFEKESVLSDV